ncbi:actin-related protein ARPC5 [Histomonas meleagridis]|uniref:actin-related protein ARPC5 n=1 Tax=Histomonas meleagridis TaxID=135588 RepID=UPI00355ACC15|nr:actin-related protein ARPC5 [Histomonas meleagridis]KAH0797101.1 actin-related protein ARPC5 [Histomonas meleagridis]
MSYVDTINQRAEQAKGEVRSNPGNALKTVLQELPVRPKHVIEKSDSKDVQARKMTEAKDAAAKAVCSILCSIESAKLATAIKALTDDERDTLMKFVYRGFSEREMVDGKPKCTYDCNLLLKAHEEITKINGNGPIIRSIHTRLEV